MNGTTRARSFVWATLWGVTTLAVMGCTTSGTSRTTRGVVTEPAGTMPVETQVVEGYSLDEAGRMAAEDQQRTAEARPAPKARYQDRPVHTPRRTTSVTPQARRP